MLQDKIKTALHNYETENISVNLVLFLLSWQVAMARGSLSTVPLSFCIIGSTLSYVRVCVCVYVCACAHQLSILYHY